MTEPDESIQLPPRIRALSTADVGAHLIAAAQFGGDAGVIAAAALLTEAGTMRLLGRHDVHAYLVCGRPGMIHVRWDELAAALADGHQFGSHGNAAILRLAASMAGVGYPVPTLNAILFQVDADDLGAVLRAVVTVARHGTAPPPGWPGTPPAPVRPDLQALVGDALPVLQAAVVATGMYSQRP